VTFQDALAEGVLGTKALSTRFFVGFDESNRTRQAPHLPNHITWVLGHCAFTMHRVAQQLDGKPHPERDFVTERRGSGAGGFEQETVAFDSEPADEPEHYPSLARAREIFEDACDRLAAAVRSADAATLQREVPWGSGNTQIPLWALVQRVTFHNGVHTGQLTDLRRALGLERVIK